MKTLSAGLQALFDSDEPFTMADCYTINLSNGTELKLVDFDTDITYLAETWVSNGPPIERSDVRHVIGLEVDTLDLTIHPKETDLIGPVTWMKAMSSGMLDGASCRLDRVFMDMNGVPQGLINRFVGDFAQITSNRISIDITVESPTIVLQTMMPRNVYQTGCQNTLFDNACGLSQAANTVSGSVSGSITTLGFGSTVVSGATSTYFDLGTLIFTSGDLAGTRRTVKSWTASGGAITLLSPLPFAPEATDTFTITPGCNKTRSTCVTKFNNIVNFRGFPYVPVPETST